MIETQLATLLQSGDMCQCVNHVVSDISTLHALSGAGHGGVTNKDRVSINGSRHREQEKQEEDIIDIASHYHAHGDDEEKLSNNIFQQR